MVGSDVAKYTTFLILNIVIATCGATLLAFGAILQVDEHKGVKSFANLSIGGFAIGLGVLVFIMACYGWVAAYKKKRFMLSSYLLIIVVLFIIQIVLGAIALGSVNKAKCELDEDLESAVRELFSRNDKDSMRKIDHLQRTFHCCGVYGPQWWKGVMHKTYPWSCCPSEKDPCERPYKKGCAALYTNAIEKNVGIIGGVAIGFAPCELAAGILSWYLQLAIKKSQVLL